MDLVLIFSGLAWFLVFSALVSHESWIGILTILFGTIVVSFWFPLFSIFAVWHYIVANPFDVLGWIGSYIIVGVFWSCLKWYTFVKDALKKKMEWYNASDKSKTFVDFCKPDYNFPPQLTRNIDHIQGWMIFWPFSMVGTLIGDYVFRLFRMVWNQIKGIYPAITRRVLRGTGLEESIK